MDSFILTITVIAAFANTLTFLWQLFFGSKTLQQAIHSIKQGSQQLPNKSINTNSFMSNLKSNPIGIINLFLTASLLVVLILILNSQPRNFSSPSGLSNSLGPTNTPHNFNQPTITPTSALTVTPTPQVTVTPTSAVTVTPTPQATTPTPQTAHLPCIFNANSWPVGSSGWKVLNNVLLNDGTDLTYPSGPTIQAPCQLGNLSNYVVVAKVQVTGNEYSGPSPCFGITVRGSLTSNGWQGYLAGVGYCSSGVSGIGGVYLTGPTYIKDPNQAYKDFSPHMTMHIYQVEVNGNTLTYSVDGNPMLSWTDSRYLTGSQVGLWCYGAQLEVTSFQVTAI